MPASSILVRLFTAPANNDTGRQMPVVLQAPHGNTFGDSQKNLQTRYRRVEIYASTSLQCSAVQYSAEDINHNRRTCSRHWQELGRELRLRSGKA
ncbi:hypothetical protein BHE74_00053065 [Ensete ventricosum]|nr:hypothetical protein GW17_00053708 [Ensete ventricosum]RWW41453.1 hypothetical protein BHE74_00053065 [Ensete ventricosum]RZS24859.1 hypothetical protein BHM03_00057975 [Ensete ventricosum]